MFVAIVASFGQPSQKIGGRFGQAMHTSRFAEGFAFLVGGFWCLQNF